jgi:hypothetical protein
MRVRRNRRAARVAGPLTEKQARLLNENSSARRAYLCGSHSIEDEEQQDSNIIAEAYECDEPKDDGAEQDVEPKEGGAEVVKESTEEAETIKIEKPKFADEEDTDTVSFNLSDLEEGKSDTETHKAIQTKQALGSLKKDKSDVDIGDGLVHSGKPGGEVVAKGVPLPKGQTEASDAFSSLPGNLGSEARKLNGFIKNYEKMSRQKGVVDMAMKDYLRDVITPARKSFLDTQKLNQEYITQDNRSLLEKYLKHWAEKVGNPGFFSECHKAIEENLYTENTPSAVGASSAPSTPFGIDDDDLSDMSDIDFDSPDVQSQMGELSEELDDEQKAQIGDNVLTMFDKIPKDILPGLIQNQ